MGRCKLEIRNKGGVMYKFEVEKMNCMSCVHNIEDELKDIDKGVKIKPDFKSKTLEVQSEIAREKVKRAIEDAGYQVKDLI